MLQFNRATWLTLRKVFDFGYRDQDLKLIYINTGSQFPREGAVHQNDTRYESYVEIQYYKWVKWCKYNIHRLTNRKMETLLNSSVTVDKIPYTAVKEGEAEVLFPSSNDVFYNPVQEFNRDMSVAVIKEFIKEYTPEMAHKRKGCTKVLSSSQEKLQTISSQGNIKIMEALAASGLRSIRYAKEIPNIDSIIANDYSSQAVESIKRNIRHNNVEHIVKPSHEEASLLMYQHRKPQKQFHVVDLDPYGSPAAFLDSAVQCVSDGGLLLVTCTDMAILCGNHSETCHAKYGAVSLKSKNCHEMALRIILQSIESQANRYGRYIVPLLSLSADFYIRVFVKIHISPNEVKKSVSKLAMVFKCTGCETFHLQHLAKINIEGRKISPSTGPVVGMNCNFCGHKHQMGGPIWADNIYDKDFVQKLLKTVQEEAESYNTSKRMIGVLSVITEELEDCPLYYVVPDLCAVVHAVTPSMLEFRSAILNAGYRVSLSHACQHSVKTDASDEVIWDIVREWVKLHPVKRDLTGTAGGVILSKEPRTKVSFELHPQANPTSRLQNMCRFQLNPEPYWGPKMRAKTSLLSTKSIEKKKHFQGKRRKKCQIGKDLKQFPCKRFKKGECELGDDCRYSHDINITTEETTT